MYDGQPLASVAPDYQGHSFAHVPLSYCSYLPPLKISVAASNHKNILRRHPHNVRLPVGEYHMQRRQTRTCHAMSALSMTRPGSDDAYSGWNSTVPLLPPLFRAT